MSRWKQLAPLAALLLSSAPARAQIPDAATRLGAAERAVVDAIARDGFAATIYAVLAGDGALLWPGAPVVVGPDSARLLLRAQRGLDSLQFSWQPLGLELSGDATIGVTWGVALAIPPSRNARIGRYIAAWRQSGETWKLAAFVPIGVFPPAATTIPPELKGLRRAAIPAAGPGAPLVSVDLAFARLAGDSGAALAFERYATPDAVTLGAGLLNRGPAAIGRALRAGPPSHWAWHPVLVGIAGSLDLGYTVGESEIRPNDGGPVNYGKYLSIWRRMPSGEYRYLTDGGNPRPMSP